uniref:Uncharacterized protein n=1 Tax=Ixodes ricinus TaxID=34613 RepID=A0A6B0UQ53_IXORI
MAAGSIGSTGQPAWVLPLLCGLGSRNAMWDTSAPTRWRDGLIVQRVQHQCPLLLRGCPASFWSLFSSTWIYRCPHTRGWTCGWRLYLVQTFLRVNFSFFRGVASGRTKKLPFFVEPLAPSCHLR